MSDVFAAFQNTIHGWFQQNAQQFQYVTLPAAQVSAVPGAAEIAYGQPLTPQKSYFRLWLSEMFLTDAKNWFTDLFPAVHAATTLKFGGQNAVTVSRVGTPTEEQMAGGPRLNLCLLDLTPFSGGTVTVQTTLLAVPGKNDLAAALGVLKDVSELVAPPLGTALAVAQKVSGGLQSLADVTGATPRLHFAQTFTNAGGGGGADLRTGYVAVLRATAQSVDAARLRVVNDRLHLAPASQSGPTTAFTGCDYLLLRIEGRTERDDWRLAPIADPLDRAITAAQMGRTDEVQAYRTVALTAALESPDLAVHDRRRVVQAIKAEIGDWEAGALGGTGDQARDLNGIMAARALPLDQAANLPPLTFAEVFGA